MTMYSYQHLRLATGCRCARRDATNHFGKARELRGPQFIHLEPDSQHIHQPPSTQYVSDQQHSEHHGVVSQQRLPGLQPWDTHGGQRNVRDRDDWTQPGFDFNKFNHDIPTVPMPGSSFPTTLDSLPPNPIPGPASCCRKAPPLGRASAESIPQSTGTAVVTPSADEQLAHWSKEYDLNLNQHHGGKGEDGSIWSPDFFPTPIIDAPQTTMYPMPASYGSIENPMTSYQHERLRESASWRPQQLPYYADSGIGASVANRADGSEDMPHCFECPCGEECTCLMCTAHPHNTTSIGWVRDLYPHWLSDPANLPTVPRCAHQVTSSHDAATGIDEHAPSQSNPIEGPTNPATNETYDDAIYNPPVEPYAGEPSTLERMSSRDYLYFEYDLPELPPYPELAPNPCTAAPGTCECAEGCLCAGCQCHTGHGHDVVNDPYFGMPLESADEANQDGRTGIN
ncbi:MAG: hypothetical protein Q9169_004505 [Polycauliona sp. 2 TL-2023]